MSLRALVGRRVGAYGLGYLARERLMFVAASPDSATLRRRRIAAALALAAVAAIAMLVVVRSLSGGDEGRVPCSCRAATRA